MLKRLASLAMSTCIIKALPSTLDIKINSPSVLYFLVILTHFEKIKSGKMLTLNFCLSVLVLTAVN